MMRVVLLTSFLVTVINAQVRPDNYYEIFNEPKQPEHTMTKYKGIGSRCNIGDLMEVARSGDVTEAEKVSFLNSHNNYRRKVAKGLETQGKSGPQPPAADMLELTWDDELAAFAQRWAEQCPDSGFSHDKNRRNGRWSWVGQNMFSDREVRFPSMGIPDPPLTAHSHKAVEVWTSEAAYFNKENINPFEYVSGAGHYTQIAWGNTRKLGCGFFMTRGNQGRRFGLAIWERYVVCNYGPGGNINGNAMYIIGAAASKCPSGTVKSNGLCSAGGTSNNTTGTSNKVTIPAARSEITTSNGATDVWTHVSAIIISLPLLVLTAAEVASGTH